MDKKPYLGRYPSAARYLIEQDVAASPRQFRRDFKWSEGLDIVYTLKGLTPVNFQRYSDTLLLLAYQESMRYNEYKWKFARFEVKLGRLPKGKDLPDIASFQAAMHDDPEIMIYGPGYDTPQKYFLKDKVLDIIDIARRYQGKINRQNPYKVVKLIVSIREPI